MALSVKMVASLVLLLATPQARGRHTCACMHHTILACRRRHRFNDSILIHNLTWPSRIRMATCACIYHYPLCTTKNDPSLSHVASLPAARCHGLNRPIAATKTPSVGQLQRQKHYGAAVHSARLLSSLQKPRRPRVLRSVAADATATPARQLPPPASPGKPPRPASSPRLRESAAACLPRPWGPVRTKGPM